MGDYKVYQKSCATEFLEPCIILVHLPPQNEHPPEQLPASWLKAKRVLSPRQGKGRLKDCSQETPITAEALTASWNPQEGQVWNHHRFTASICYSTGSSLEETWTWKKYSLEVWLKKRDGFNGCGSAQHAEGAFSDTCPLEPPVTLVF